MDTVQAIRVRDMLLRSKDGVFDMIEARDEEFLHKGIRSTFALSSRKHMIRGSLFDIFCQVSQSYWSMPTVPPS